mgnify:CR=1 FL=1
MEIDETEISEDLNEKICEEGKKKGEVSKNKEHKRKNRKGN